jgi:hypothetical protein
MTLDFNLYDAPPPADLTGAYALRTQAQGQAANALANLFGPLAQTIQQGTEHKRRLEEIRQEAAGRSKIAEAQRQYEAEMEAAGQQAEALLRARLSEPGFLQKEKTSAAAVLYPGQDQASLTKTLAANRATPGTDGYKAVEDHVKSLFQSREVTWVGGQDKFLQMADQVAMAIAGVDNAADIPAPVRAMVLKAANDLAPELEIDTREEAIESFRKKAADDFSARFGTGIGGRQVTEAFTQAGEAAAMQTAPQSTDVPNADFFGELGLLLDELLPGAMGEIFKARVDTAARTETPFRIEAGEGADPYLDLVWPRGKPDDEATFRIEDLLNTPGPARDEALGKLKGGAGVRTTPSERRDLGQKPSGAPRPAPIGKPRTLAPPAAGTAPTSPLDAFENFPKYLKSRGGG